MGRRPLRYVRTTLQDFNGELYIDKPNNKTRKNAKELFHIRHHSLYTPRDFDISPYFEIVKPTLAKDFNYRNIEWSKHNQPTDF